MGMQRASVFFYANTDGVGGSKGGRQGQQMAADAAEEASRGDGVWDLAAAATGAGRGMRGQRACWFMQAARAGRGRWVGAGPSLLASWRRGEAGVGDVSWAVASGKSATLVAPKCGARP